MIKWNFTDEEMDRIAQCRDDMVRLANADWRVRNEELGKYGERIRQAARHSLAGTLHRVDSVQLEQGAAIAMTLPIVVEVR